MSKVPEEMLQAIKSYNGPVRRVRKGWVPGAGDLNVWASRRAVGNNGVPDGWILKKQKKRAEFKNDLYTQYQNSGLTHRMTYDKWRRRHFARWNRAKKRKLKMNQSG